MLCQPTASKTEARNGLETTVCSQCGQAYLSFRKRVCPKG